MINLYEIKPGDLLVIKNGRQVEYSENMNDGQWIEVISSEGNELIHSQDILEVLNDKAR
ncbi:hypothetical protein HNH53_002925 [Escherichia fergusonii]|nr:hypothetical protein [Escherichia fergusonii]EFO7694430.1 hypothetical protein [Escherichia fergusonii]EHX5840653.1 hypothetical protein [Escherichia fergusonii]